MKLSLLFVIIFISTTISLSAAQYDTTLRGFMSSKADDTRLVLAKSTLHTDASTPTFLHFHLSDILVIDPAVCGGSLGECACVEGSRYLVDLEAGRVYDFVGEETHLIQVANPGKVCTSEAWTDAFYVSTKGSIPEVPELPAMPVSCASSVVEHFACDAGRRGGLRNRK